jgi:hypothetical protein
MSTTSQRALGARVARILGSPMRRARLAIALLGVLLPYLARVPGSLMGRSQWLNSYLAAGVQGFLFMGFFNAFVWAAFLDSASGYASRRRS